jgi:hypothetical protein
VAVIIVVMLVIGLGRRLEWKPRVTVRAVMVVFMGPKPMAVFKGAIHRVRGGFVTTRREDTSKRRPG